MTYKELEKDSEYYKKLGNVLRIGRLKAGKSQEELGAFLGVTFQQIQKYEKGQNRISPKRLIDFCNLINLNIEDVLKINTNGEPLLNNPNLYSEIKFRKSTASILGKINKLQDKDYFLVKKLVESLVERAA